MADVTKTQASAASDDLRRLRQTVTLGALLLAIAHLIWPDLAIDAITLALVVIAILAQNLRLKLLPSEIQTSRWRVCASSLRNVSFSLLKQRD
jgi:hypothetical protein